MSRRTGDYWLFGRTAPPAMLMVVALLAAFAFAVARPAPALAQGTPEMPAAGPCDAPPLPPGTPTPMEPEASPPMMEHEATPAVEETAGAIGTVVEEEEPTPTPVPAGTPAAEDVAAEAAAAVENVLNCLSAGNYEAAVALHTENGLLQAFGTDNPYDALAQLEEFPFPPLTLLSAGDVWTHDDGRVSIDITYTIGSYQYYHERQYLAQEGEYWLLDAFQTLPAEAEGDTTAFGVTLAEYSFTPNVSSVVATDVLIIQGTNSGVEPHEIALLKLPEGADPMGLLDGSIPEDQIEFIGQIFVEPGALGEMVLLGLPPGVYTMVCFIPAPDGTPHIALGMVTTFEVTEPAA